MFEESYGETVKTFKARMSKLVNTWDTTKAVISG